MPPADKVVSLSDDINTTDNIVWMDEEQNLAPPDTMQHAPTQRIGLILFPLNLTLNVTMINKERNAKNQNKHR